MTRNCLRCGHEFKTVEKFIRLCTSCHRYNESQEASIPVHSIAHRHRAGIQDETVSGTHNAKSAYD